MYKILAYIEKIIFYLQGKGWSRNTILREVKFASHFIKDPNCIIDIGGNVGNYSLQLRKLYLNASIHIFEPSTVNQVVLDKIFKNDSKVKINKCALANENTSMYLYSNIPGSGLGSLTKRDLNHFSIDFNHKEEVQVIRFEDYWLHELNKCEIDFVKIDVEGHELDVLNGFGDAINHVKLIQFEFGGCNIDTRTFFHDFFKFFKMKNFQIYRLTPIGLKKLHYYTESDEVFMTTNYLCIKNN